MTTFFRHYIASVARSTPCKCVCRADQRLFTELLPGLPFVAMQRWRSSAPACILIHRRALTLISDDGCMPRMS